MISVTCYTSFSPGAPGFHLNLAWTFSLAVAIIAPAHQDNLPTEDSI